MVPTEIPRYPVIMYDMMSHDAMDVYNELREFVGSKLSFPSQVKPKPSIYGTVKLGYAMIINDIHQKNY